MKGKYRLIHNHSFPDDKSVSDQIAKHKGSVKYQTIDDAIESILTLGIGCILSKMDILHAFKVIPVNPCDWAKLGLYWDSVYWFDLTLPQRGRTSRKIFEYLSKALEWIANNKLSICHIHHVLDDFLMISLYKLLALKECQLFVDTFDYLGIPTIQDKTESGSTLVFLGVELDSNLFQACLPQDKIDNCKSKIESVLAKASVTGLQLESLAGLLNFACMEVRPGRPFMRRLFDRIATVKHQYHKIKVSGPLAKDLNLWLTFINSYNGITFFPSLEWISPHTHHCYTDSSKTGFSIVFQSHWSYGSFPKTWQKYNICFLEAYPIMLLFQLLNKMLQNKKIILHTDNLALVHILNRQTSKDHVNMILIRDIALKAITHNIVFRAEHVPGIQNTLADPLFRLQVDLFQSRA